MTEKAPLRRGSFRPFDRSVDKVWSRVDGCDREPFPGDAGRMYRLASTSVSRRSRTVLTISMKAVPSTHFFRHSALPHLLRNSFAFARMSATIAETDTDNTLSFHRDRTKSSRTRH